MYSNVIRDFKLALLTHSEHFEFVLEYLHEE